MYTITTHTLTGEAHRYELDSLDEVDQYVSRVQYRDGSHLIAVADDPITLLYASQIKHVTVEGVTKEGVAEYEADRRDRLEAAYQEQMARKRAEGMMNSRHPAGNAIAGGLTGSAEACHSESALARVVR